MKVTCMVPSARAVIPSLPMSPPVMLGAAFAMTGDHALAHAPVRVDMLPVSAAKR